MEKRKYLLIIIFISISLFIRLIYVSFFLDNTKYYFIDTSHYFTAAVNIVDNGTFNIVAKRPKFIYEREPVYPIFIAAVFFLFGKSFLAVRIIQSIFIALSGLLFYKILLNISSYKFTLIGAFIYLFYPFYLFFSGFLATESILLPMLIIFTYLCIKYLSSQNNIYFYGASVLLGITFHTRITSIVLFLPLILLPFLIGANLNFTWIKKLFISLIIVFIISTPWAIRNYKVLGRFTLPYTAGEREIGKSAIQWRIGFMIKKGVVNRLSENFVNYFSPFITEFLTKNKFQKDIFQTISFICVTPLLISTIILPFFKRNKYLIFLYSFLIFYFIPYLILFGQTRYRLPTDFLMIIFMTHSLEKIYTNLIGKDNN